MQDRKNRLPQLSIPLYCMCGTLVENVLAKIGVMSRDRIARISKVIYLEFGKKIISGSSFYPIYLRVESAKFTCL